MISRFRMGAEMRYLASYSEGSGWDVLVPEADLSTWFKCDQRNRLG